jgi:RNA methyltransferase, TrmH family
VKPAESRAILRVVEVIASRKNPLVSQMRRLAQGAGDVPVHMLLDGLHLVEEARAAHVPLVCVAFSGGVLAALDGRARRLATSLAGVGVRVVQVSDSVLEAMSPVTTPTGVVGIAARPKANLDSLLPPQVSNPFIVVAVDVQDPGNLGAMVRVAEAAGATSLVAAGASADPFGWKALRGAMGSAFRLFVASERDASAALDLFKSRGVRLVAATPSVAERFDRVDWTIPTAVLLGSEGTGLPSELIERADLKVSIPMQPPVESLNVAVSAALLAYEARRQRAATRSS